MPQYKIKKERIGLEEQSWAFFVVYLIISLSFLHPDRLGLSDGGQGWSDGRKGRPEGRRGGHCDGQRRLRAVHGHVPGGLPHLHGEG